jgi:hypothetical protein
VFPPGVLWHRAPKGALKVSFAQCSLGGAGWLEAIMIFLWFSGYAVPTDAHDFLFTDPHNLKIL